MDFGVGRGWRLDDAPGGHTGIREVRVRATGRVRIPQAVTQAFERLRLMSGANSRGLYTPVPMMTCLSPCLGLERETYPSLMRSAPASIACSVHLASLFELFLSSVASTWAMAMAFFVRFVFVSLLAKFQLHKGSVIEGLAELHPAVAAITGLIAITFGHANNSYMIRGVGETSTALSGVGSPTLW